MKSIRRYFEIWARGKVLSRKIIVKNKKYPIYVSPDAQLKYIKGNLLGGFDQDLIDIAQTFIRENSVVWDIGANVGVFTFASSLIAQKGEVVSVEPDNWLVEVLRQTQKLKTYCDRDHTTGQNCE